MKIHMMKIRKSAYKGIMILCLGQQSNRFSGLNPERFHKSFHCGNIQASFQKYTMIRLLKLNNKFTKKQIINLKWSLNFSWTIKSNNMNQ